MNSSLLLSPSQDLNSLVNQYESTLESILNKHAPLKKRIITQRPSNPWYNDDIRKEKAKCRRLEKAWRRSKLTIHYDLFKTQSEVLNNLIKSSKDKYFSKIISDNKKDQKILFSTFEKMIHKNREASYPISSSPVQLANSFAEFFVNKISIIQGGFDTMPLTEPLRQPVVINEYFTSFSNVSYNDLSDHIFSLAAKSCELDPLPGRFLKVFFDKLLPIYQKVINLSLKTGTMPSKLKLSVIKPLIKKLSLPSEEFSSFRPISNLKFLSKAIEKIVSLQLVAHLEKNGLYVPL